MIKPRIKSKWFYSEAWGNELKWSHDGINWFQGVSYTEYGGSTSYVTPVWDRGATGSVAVTSTIPFTWGSADSFAFNGIYESA